MIALIIAIICLVIILAVIGVNIYMVIVMNRNSSDIKLINNKMDSRFAKINEAINNKINVLDLAEFKDLDPYLKDAYKKYIVNILSSAFMKAVNKSASDNDIKNLLKANQKEIDQMAYDIAKELETNGFSSYEDVFPELELSNGVTS
jgi:predicted PurR-regulated permease PerM